ncbi:hypothetical protein K7X08_021353 [Anisodus acutangulus]|uniref:Uncharacterized protein n=1 Tax=Anisodus acutangulus TaxID=402998 RepID=A0A9Q1RAS8_9SOLA|nr:hypothetical protein K7X08_021353 [Anisodus acutangulus]
MAIGMKQMSMVIATLGVFSFIFGVTAENKKLGLQYQEKSLLFVDTGTFPWGTTGLAAALLLWPTISEQLHITRTIHHNLQTDCPTAKTGLLGGGAFLSLDSVLFWLVALMLADNAREDYFQEADVKGELKASYADDEIIKTRA